MKFVILSTQRSGSTWVADILNGIEGVKVYGEQFLPEKRSWDVGEVDFPRFIEYENHGIRPVSIFRYLDELYGQVENVGFKLMYSQIQQLPETFLYLILKRVKVIHLVRTNYLDVLLSTKMAEARGQFHLTSSGDSLDMLQVHLDPEYVLKRVRRQQKKVNIFRNLLKMCSSSHLEVQYESLLKNPENFQVMFTFLGFKAPEQMPRSRLSRIREGQHGDEISNYIEVRDTLVEHGFEHLLH
ncbi:MAG: Stf0 family sulfotransferase [Candidatus Nitrosomaritimum yanchengensis]